jgi:predicted DCC family thiol-disulfide oxidoreductase YuxK
VGALLLYDADCAFCTRTASLVPRLHLRLEVKAIQSVDLAALGVAPSRATREIPYVSANGEVYYGYLAITRALDTGNVLLRLLGRLLRLWPLSVGGAAAYRLIAANRQRLPGGTPSCALPPLVD